MPKKSDVKAKEIHKQVKIDSFEIDYQNPNLKPFVSENRIGKELRTGHSSKTEYFTRYLGIIQLGKLSYHVLSQFYTVQAAAIKHGHSRIIFLDKDIKIRKIYVLSMPDELPAAIVSNELVWIIDKKQYALSLGTQIPEVICIPNDKGCY